jgi:hypothetical protein
VFVLWSRGSDIRALHALVRLILSKFGYRYYPHVWYMLGELMKDLVHFFVAGGWVMYPLLALSLLAVAVIIERILAYRAIADSSPGLL